MEAFKQSLELNPEPTNGAGLNLLQLYVAE